MRWNIPIWGRWGGEPVLTHAMRICHNVKIWAVISGQIAFLFNKGADKGITASSWGRLGDIVNHIACIIQFWVSAIAKHN